MHRSLRSRRPSRPPPRHCMREHRRRPPGSCSCSSPPTTRLRAWRRSPKRWRRSVPRSVPSRRSTRSCSSCSSAAGRSPSAPPRRSPQPTGSPRRSTWRAPNPTCRPTCSLRRIPIGGSSSRTSRVSRWAASSTTIRRCRRHGLSTPSRPPPRGRSPRPTSAPTGVGASSWRNPTPGSSRISSWPPSTRCRVSTCSTTTPIRPTRSTGRTPGTAPERPASWCPAPPERSPAVPRPSPTCRSGRSGVSYRSRWAPWPRRSTGRSSTART